MTGAVHIAAAAVIYKHGRFNRPCLLFLAFASHFLLDATPHYELGVPANFLLGAGVLAMLFQQARRQKDWGMPAAGLLGELPDANWLFDAGPVWHNIHSFFHFKNICPASWLCQPHKALLLAAAVYLVSQKTTPGPAGSRGNSGRRARSRIKPG